MYGKPCYIRMMHMHVFRRHMRPSMMQQLVRRLVFDVPMLTEYCVVPLKVSISL